MGAESLSERIVLALDTSDWEEFRGWCERLGPRVGVLKVGLEAFVRWGPKAVETARAHARRLFLDLKLHDIPNTVGGAVRSAADLGADFVTVHASGGPGMLRAAQDAAEERTTLLAVTLLTHLDEGAIAELGMPGEVRDRALAWAELAARSGCGGAVCSPHEVAGLRRRLPEPFVVVTPGIRPRDEIAGDDQRRTATPAEAFVAGASLIVVGRPVTRSSDPETALERLLSESELQQLG
ncbi:MAG: orotidine-5'-phosphate decarboxylase [Thermoanaerobaculia bacterium]